MVPKSAALAATYVYPLYREYQKEGKTIDASDLTGLAINLLVGNQNALVELRGRLGQMVVDEVRARRGEARRGEERSDEGVER